MDTTLLFNQLTGVYRPYIKLFQPVFDDFELFPAQWLVLKDISQNAPTTLVQISKRRAIEKPTTRKILKALSEKSLLIIEQGKDKREKKLSLSDDGRLLFSQMSERIEGIQDEIIKEAGISADQLAETYHTIRLIHEQINKMEES
ncbi:winged helix DNA-binding protein [Staphylococcus gallinarum]|jgi:DNA-binding MarR family transcriptional regulator|uniref:MarR family transcriptional regulator n=2 Tax=Staphylococcus gallinarum TaxID=1293 RepID=A0A0D0QW84_STAGA|nr:winged helix DNA-binding protein [Staphylococcus gallinarum]KIR11436.1 MarR family transcriptional regulator [Staphylococcus gallinarum]MBU7217017.1 winged helix DNA-binding protein [Staphylococcus gallinarum]MCD8784956.1 winged helix DNA-binding protein [Staphylococcus gallinarum]MCD8792771.1 winged helix DNA-binding protein [Staphylococcus gallinarum]MCD8827074.1 winged helix DNA-binding protein [Staphylococcus gallinarum]